MKRIFAMCLAMIMILSIFASCGKKGDIITDESGTEDVTGDASDVIVPVPGVVPVPGETTGTPAPTPEGGSPVKEGQEYIMFGSYPQTMEDNDDICKALEEAAGDLPSASNAGKWTSYRYLSAGQKSDYMWYIDLEHEGAKYRGVYFTEYRSYIVTEAGTEDNCFQDDNGFVKGTAYWFKYEPIKWRVLKEEGGKAFAVADKILDSQSFNDASMDSNYKTSEIRTWLNEIFYPVAVSDAQQNFVESTKVDNTAGSTADPSNMYVCEDTEDDVLLLSYADATNSAYKFASDTDRMIMGTDYAACQGLFVKSAAGNASQWWLRSPDGTDSQRSNRVKPEGLIGVNKTDVNTVGVLPAMTIILEAGDNAAA